MASLESVKAKLQLMRAGLLPVYPAIEQWEEKLVGRKMITKDRAAAGPYNTALPSDQVIMARPRVFYSSALSDVTALSSSIDLTSAASNARGSPFLKLPTEIRAQILDDALMPIRLAGDDDRHWIHSTSVILTCKQLFVEGRAIALQKNTFERTELPSFLCLRQNGFSRIKEDHTSYRDRLVFNESLTRSSLRSNRLNVDFGSNHIVEQVYYR